MIKSLLIVALVGSASTQYVQQAPRVSSSQQQQSVQAAQPDAIDQIPAWYQMAKPVQAARVSQQMPQASPSYYERIEPTYEQRREQVPTYERPGIQTNQYANYPSFSNRQPYENLNALTSGASLSNLQANRRYPSAATSGGSDVSQLRHVQHHTTPSPASYTRQQHHPGRVVWYTSKRASPYNVIRTTLPPPMYPNAHEIRGIKKLIAMTPYETTKDQLSRWYDQMKAFYYINQFVDWGTFKTMFLNRY